MTFQRDLPIGIIGSLLVCIALYIGVCLVITGMVPYNLLGEDAPLADAFTSKGLKFISVLISVGAVAGLTTTLLVGLYVQVNPFWIMAWLLCLTRANVHNGVLWWAVSAISWAWQRWLTTLNICKGSLNTPHPYSFSDLGWLGCQCFGWAVKCACALSHSFRRYTGKSWLLICW